MDQFLLRFSPSHSYTILNTLSATSSRPWPALSYNTNCFGSFVLLYIEDEQYVGNKVLLLPCINNTEHLFSFNLEIPLCHNFG